MGWGEDHCSRASHELSGCKIRWKQSEMEEKMSLHQYKVGCRQHTDGKKPNCYRPGQDLWLFSLSHGFVCCIIYSYIPLLNHKWHTSNVTIKVQVIRNMPHRPSTKAGYTIGSGTTKRENQPAAQIAAKHSIFPYMVPYMSWIFLVLVGIDSRVSRLGGKIVSHNPRMCDKPGQFNFFTFG